MTVYVSGVMRNCIVNTGGIGMNILKIRISGLSVCSSVLDLDFCASQKISENARQQLIDLNGSLFLNPVIEFAGLNGTGKTVLLNVLFFVMRMLNGRPLNNQGVLTDRMIRYMNHRPFTVETWYFLNGEITHLTTDIGLEKDFVFGGDPRLIILSETISVMSRNLRNKTEWLHSEKYQRTERRPSPEENPYLLDDVSMNIEDKRPRQPNSGCRESFFQSGGYSAFSQKSAGADDSFPESGY